MLQILDSLDRVGKTKAIGYLPLDTVSKIAKISIPDLEKKYLQHGLCVQVLDENETCIRSGAIFVYDRPALLGICREFEALLIDLSWPMEADAIVMKIAREWFPENDSIMPFIRAIYGDEILASEK